MNIKKLFSSVQTFFRETLWQIDIAGMNKPKGYLITCLRFAYKIQDDFRTGVFTLPASSLAYITLLSFVPLIALSFALAKAFGVHNMLAPMLLNFLAPIGPKSREITTVIVSYVDKINVSVLGAVGLVVLVYTVVNTIQQIEQAFNRLWQIHKPRGLLQKFRDYLSVLLVAPLLMVAAIGLTTSVMSNTVVQALHHIEPFGTIILYLSKFLPYLLMIITFTMIYYLLPNTKVSIRSALTGGVVAGLLWETISWAFAKFLVSTAHYSAIYSGFAMVLIFMLWLYFNWIVMLIGVKIAYHHQFPATLRVKNDTEIFTERFQYKLAVAAMYCIDLHHYKGLERWTLNSLVRHFGLPVFPVLRVLEALEDNKIVFLIKDDMTYIPMRDIEKITVQEVFSAVEKNLHEAAAFSSLAGGSPTVNALLLKLDEGVKNSLEGETVKSLVLASLKTSDREQMS